ncbi:Oidioi.mRNA.OKI2018_I69.XSR.g14551.t1.cds [Oikopleura dioica]|uniref:Oidioi.mRNA.OKI2018_I69.XSR.g14551.t1.cds n=1 Tax=Oikopleura dioica TaxID=34765 RepID=A0ABN7SA42_OIKDI|nr:Oidioi.mRNA.OKI2018_I69.XSR.g14551.t1.cds [Oikopleura dioica]
MSIPRFFQKFQEVYAYRRLEAMSNWSQDSSKKRKLESHEENSSKKQKIEGKPVGVRIKIDRTALKRATKKSPAHALTKKYPSLPAANSNEATEAESDDEYEIITTVLEKASMEGHHAMAIHTDCQGNKTILRAAFKQLEDDHF